MAKFYLSDSKTNTVETVEMENADSAFKEAQRRNKADVTANWKAYDERGDLIYGLAICR